MRLLRVFAAASALVVAVGGMGALSSTAAADEVGALVSADPVDFTPQIEDGEVKSIVQIGDKIYLGGSFTQVREVGANKPVLDRARILAFDATTGKIDTSFAPVLNQGEASVLLPAPDGQSLYVGGNFTKVNDVFHPRLTRLDADTGQPVAGFAPQLDAKVHDLRLAGGRLYVSGIFSTVNGAAKSALATVHPDTGATDPFMGVDVTGVFNGGGTFVTKMDITADGSRLVGVGNFTAVGGQSRSQIFMLDLTGSQATVANWHTARYADECSDSFNSYMRDVDFSPDGEYFVVTTTGAPRGTAKLCDTQARWENAATGSNKQPTWVNWTGGDTTYAVEITDHVVYTGGHFRWSNNPFGSDQPGQGAVDRQGIAALDPSNGMPFSWNPGRTRGVGVFDLLVTQQGLWMGSDTDIAGGETHRKIAMFPTAGGKNLPRIETGKLPGNVYTGGIIGTFSTTNALRHRSFDGSTAGAAVEDSTAGLDWRNVRGAFMLNGSLYYGWSDGSFNSRSFDGTTLGAATPVNGSDLLTPMTTWHDQVKSITAMFYHDGKIYYTRGDSRLYYRYFTPESRTVGALELTAAQNLSGLSWSSVRGMFTSGNRLYWVSSSDGDVRSVDFTGGVPSGSSTLHVQGDWRARAVFIYAGTPNETPTAAFTRNCAELTCSFNASTSADPDGTIVSYDWDFGDGQTGTGETPSHEYDEGGTYTVKLTVTDERGGTGVVEHTVTVAENQAGIAFRGTDGFNANTTAPSVQIPATVQAGDGLVLILTTNSGTVGVTPPAGWTQVASKTDSAAKSYVWKRTATGGDAGQLATVGLDVFVKADLRLLAYANTDASDPVIDAVTASDANVTAHQTASVNVTEPGSWVVSYWADKSSATTAWTVPAGVTARGTQIGTGAGRVTSLVADTNGAVGTGSYAGLTATTDAASRAYMWTIVLKRS